MDAILHRCRVIGAEMGHFVNQIEYYLVFEVRKYSVQSTLLIASSQVLECSWTDLLANIAKSKDVDQVIAAHNAFLQAIIEHAMLNSESQACD